MSAEPNGAPALASSAGRGTIACACVERHARPRFIVVTGGPGAGKSAVLELAKRRFCRHVKVLPEAASMLFAGGFPRGALKPAQRAIYFVQRELENAANDVDDAAIVLCDRGTLDGMAYWPGDEASFFEGLSTSKARELAPYDMVLHLRVPRPEHYDHSNPVRVEPAAAAAALDEKIVRAWDGHPRRRVVAGTIDFLDKAREALAVLAAELPACCRTST